MITIVYVNGTHQYEVDDTLTDLESHIQQMEATGIEVSLELHYRVLSDRVYEMVLDGGGVAVIITKRPPRHSEALGSYEDLDDYIASRERFR